MTNAEWQLTGGVAECYETHLVPVVFAPWARDLLARAGTAPGARLLDLACGTGIVARLAAEGGAAATGADINEGMLAVAERCASGRNVSFVRADAGELPVPNESFDVVICQQGLQFFPDKAAALSECLRVLKRGGRAVFCTARGLDENPLMRAQVAAFGRHLGAETTGAIRAVCAYPDAEATHAAFGAAGFAPVRVETVVLDLHAPDAAGFVEGLMQATPVAERIAALDAEARAALRDDILEEFGACHEGKALRFPHSANVVVAARPA